MLRTLVDNLLLTSILVGICLTFVWLLIARSRFYESQRPQWTGEINAYDYYKRNPTKLRAGSDPLWVLEVRAYDELGVYRARCNIDSAWNDPTVTPGVRRKAKRSVRFMRDMYLKRERNAIEATALAEIPERV
jgi:hypothetical protein